MTPNFNPSSSDCSMVSPNKSAGLASYANAKAGILLDKFALIHFPSFTSCGSLARLGIGTISVEARHPHTLATSHW